MDFLACVGTTTLESIFLKVQRTRQFALGSAPPASRSPVLNLSSEGCPRVHVWRGLRCVRASPRGARSCWCVPGPSRTDRGLCTSSSPGALQCHSSPSPLCLSRHFFAFAGSCSSRWPYRPRSRKPHAGPWVWDLNSALSSHVPALPSTSNIIRWHRLSESLRVPCHGHPSLVSQIPAATQEIELGWPTHRVRPS